MNASTTTVTVHLAAEGATRASVVPARPRQNWVLNPIQDSLFIIVAPLIVLGVGLLAFAKLGAAAATSLVIVTHIVMTVAHHLPTFIRIYGDLELFKRFKWNFVLAPIVPIAFSIAVLAYINAHDYPVEYFLYLYIMLALWDPWHFLRQHYGFMRIYDRQNAAPLKLASNMDWWLCVTWFVHIMAASGAWLPDLLSDLNSSAHIPILLSVSSQMIASLARLTGIAAVAMTIVYACYLGWALRNGYFVSWAKLALLIATFGVMYLTYTPNALIERLAPGWSFKVGFAAVGIVHMTQYLAIVWRYNRTLAKTGARARSGWFRFLHADRRWLAVACFAALYVIVCLAYGDLLTTKHDNRLLMSVLLALGFTSTLLHYYFDGFIWKMRHRQNREALLESDAGESTSSWWQSAKRSGALTMFVRQAAYFGLPMAILTVGAMSAWSTPTPNYIAHMYRAQSLSSSGDAASAEAEARLAYADMNRQLPIASKLAELRPTSAREAELAFLLYNQSMYEHLVMPQLAGKTPRRTDLADHRRNVARAGMTLQSALERGGELGHPGREKLTREEAIRVMESWKRQVAR